MKGTTWQLHAKSQSSEEAQLASRTDCLAHLLMNLSAQVQKRLKGCNRSIQHVQNVHEVMQVLADGTVRQAEGSDTHLLSNDFPVAQVGIQLDRVGRASSGEFEATTVGLDELPLGSLVEVELSDLGSVLCCPGVVDLVDGLRRDAAVVVLLNQVRVGSVADHEFEL